MGWRTLLTSYLLNNLFLGEGVLWRRETLIKMKKLGLELVDVWLEVGTLDFYLSCKESKQRVNFIAICSDLLLLLIDFLLQPYWLNCHNHVLKKFIVQKQFSIMHLTVSHVVSVIQPSFQIDKCIPLLWTQYYYVN